MKTSYQNFNLETWLLKQENNINYFFLGTIMCIQCSLYLGKYPTSIIFFFIAIFTFSTALLWIYKQVSYPDFRFLMIINSIFKLEFPVIGWAYNKNIKNITKGMDNELKEHSVKMIDSWRDYVLFTPMTEINAPELFSWLAIDKKELTQKVFEKIDYKAFMGAFLYYFLTLNSSSRDEALTLIGQNKSYDKSKVLNLFSLVFELLPNPEDFNDIANYKINKDLKFHLNASIPEDNTRYTLQNPEIIKHFYQTNPEIFQNQMATNGFMILFFSKFYETDKETHIFVNQIFHKISLKNDIIEKSQLNNEIIEEEPDSFKL